MRKLLPPLLAVALAGAPFGTTAQELGRLFLTPEQRATLDARRKARLPDKPAAVVVASPTTRMDGFVLRSDGKSTIWVNGEPTREGDQPDAPRVGDRPHEGISIPTGESGSRARLKPGQAVDVGTGEVRDVIGRGGIRVRGGP